MPTTEILTPNPENLALAAAAIQAGDLVAFPTETVYGLGANALDAAAVAKIFIAKGRPSSDPLIVHLSGPEQLEQVALNIPPLAMELAAAFWPGPLTLILPKAPVIPDNTTAGLPRVGLRVPQHPIALALIRAAERPICAPSANLFSRPSPTTAQHVWEDLAGRVSLILDGGASPLGLESTIVDLCQDPPQVLRAGGLSLEALRAYIPEVGFRPRTLQTDESAMAAPGQLLKHYSPRARVEVFLGSNEQIALEILARAYHYQVAGQKVGLLISEALAQDLNLPGAEVFILGGTDESAARSLFAALRDLDRRGVDCILAQGYEGGGLALALQDRLMRAAEGRVIRL
jgi:L-threonylcarbamoyladenylate synthase